MGGNAAGWCGGDTALQSEGSGAAAVSVRRLKLPSSVTGWVRSGCGLLIRAGRYWAEGNKGARLGAGSCGD